MAAARAREACGIPGTSVHTTYLCRDKPAMKEALRAAGVPCARSAAPRSPATTCASSPPRSASRSSSSRLPAPARRAPSGSTRADELDDAIARSGVDHGAEVAVEEFVDGHEGFYDTISIDGEVAVEFVTHYYPNVLEAMRTRWISPQFVTTNRIDAPGYDELRELGQRVITALGIGTSATHMEWFAGSKGLYFSEIGSRPPGVRAWDLYAAANDIDIYREWANAIVHGTLGSAPSRRFAAGMIALRPERDGSITGYDGVDEVAAPPRRVGDRRPPAAARAHRPSPSRPATWPTPGCACATPTTTRCAACSTTSAAPSGSAPGDAEPAGRPGRSRASTATTALDAGGARRPHRARWRRSRSSTGSRARSPSTVRRSACASSTSASACPTTSASSCSTRTGSGGCSRSRFPTARASSTSWRSPTASARG